MKSSYLSRFTPSLMPPETLEAIFVQRHWLVNDLIEVIHESAMTANKHFRLLVGMRGIGKTHLISLIYYRVSKIEELRDKLLIAWLPEDPNISSFLNLLLEIFKALQKEYPDEYKVKLEEKVNALYQLSEDEAEFNAEILLKEFVDQRTVLLLIENLDDLFDGLGEIGQKQFRAYIQNNSFLTILATAQILFDGVKLYDYPFYGFFYPHYLEDLKLDEAVDLLTQIAKLEKDRNLESFIRSPAGKDRIRAIHHLAGGNPRVYVIFSEFLSRKSLDELETPFMRMLDELTPYYQARMKWLSREQRKIVEFLVERRASVPKSDIVRYCFLNQQTASSQLKDLQEKGYLKEEKIGQVCYYELREVLMRFCLEVKKQRGKHIRLFVDFLRIWYTREELQQRWESCLASSQDSSTFQGRFLQPSLRLEGSHRHQQSSPLSLEQEYLRRSLEATDTEEDPRVAAYIKEFWVCDEKKDFLQGLGLIEKLVEIRGHEFDWLLQGYCLGELKRYEEALASYDRALAIKPDDHDAWYNRGTALFKLGQFEEALASYDRALAIKPDYHLAWNIRGIALFNLGQFEEAIASFDRALAINPDDHGVWFNRGIALDNLGQLEEAIASWDRALAINPDYHYAWNNRGFALLKLGKFEEASTCFDRAIELGSNSSAVFFNRAISILGFDRWDEGMTALENAIKKIQNKKEISADDTELIIDILFKNTQDSVVWKSRLTLLIQVFDKYEILSLLGQGLVKSISTIMPETVSNKTAQTWLELWRELTSEYQEFQLPLRLLNTAVEYKVKKGDRRVLLELAIEERQLLEQVLKIE